MRKTLIGRCAAVAAYGLGLCLVAVAFLVVGMLFRSEHDVSLSMTVNQAPDIVYETLTDCGRLPAWFVQATAVDIRRRQHGSTQWTVTFSGSERVTVNVMEIRPPSDLIWRFLSDNRHMTCYWEFALTSENGGAVLGLDVHGVARHPLHRITSKSRIDDEAFLRQFLEALAGKFNETPVIILGNKDSRVLFVPLHRG